MTRVNISNYRGLQSTFNKKFCIQKVQLSNSSNPHKIKHHLVPICRLRQLLWISPPLVAIKAQMKKVACYCVILMTFQSKQSAVCLLILAMHLIAALG